MKKRTPECHQKQPSDNILPAQSVPLVDAAIRPIFAEHSSMSMVRTLVGFGYDVHRLAAGESLILAGVPIDSEIGTVAHSDGDVLLHALCDAILGALGMGDIGEHFPDTDQQWKNASSSVFVAEVIRLMKEQGCSLINVDAALVLEAPKLKKYKAAMRSSLAQMLQLPEQRVNIKATTSEKLGFVGEGKGVQAYCVCALLTHESFD